MSRITLCADIGGTHITCRLFDLDTLSFADDHPVVKEVNSHGSADQILNAWSAAITEAAGFTPVNELHGLGFAMPGPFDYQRGIGLFSGVQKFDALNGANIKEELAKTLSLPGDFRIRFLNDAACFAIGESLTGEARHYQRLLAITLGTGFGTTFIANHRPIAGVCGIPDDGFLYHMALGDSIADDWFSTRWFIARYRSLTGEEITGARQLAEMATNNPLIAGIFNEFGKNLGQFLAPWLLQFQAGGLVIGGSISKASHLFGHTLNEALHLAGCATTTHISTMHQDSALCGSAFLCDDDFYHSITNTLPA